MSFPAPRTPLARGGGDCLSVVLPVRNEAPNLVAVHRALAERLAPELAGRVREVEFLFVDDGSDDGSVKVIASLARIDPRVRLIRLASRRGQSSAVWAGFRASRGTFVATMDADQQQDPVDLLPMLDRLIRSPSIDAVLGVRQVRCDGALRRWSSRFANALRRRVTRDRLRDAGCSLKLMRREALAALVPFDGMHRFIGTVLLQRGKCVVEEPVSHAPRRFGKPKYGLCNRVVRTTVDLIGVRWLARRSLEERWVEDVARHSDAQPVPRSGSLPMPIK